MINVDELLAEIESSGCRVKLDRNGLIAIRGPRALLPEISEKLQPYRAEIAEYLSRRSNGAVATPPAPHQCWRCGASGNAPDLDEQVEIVKHEHLKRGDVFIWTDREFARLRELLRPGDLIAVAANFYRVISPNYGSVAVIRDGQMIEIRRRDLADA